MAENADLDLDAKPASGNKKKIIIIVLVGLLLVAASVGGTLMLLGGGEDEGDAAQEDAAVLVPKAHYLGLENMVVNFAQKGPVKHLQVEMQLMSHDPEVLKAVEEHMPVVRNDILVLLSSQNHEQLSSREGKELLRGELLAAVQKIVKENAGLDGPQAIYFTNFVMQ